MDSFKFKFFFKKKTLLEVEFIHFLNKYPAPKHLNYFWTFGSLSPSYTFSLNIKIFLKYIKIIVQLLTIIFFVQYLGGDSYCSRVLSTDSFINCTPSQSRKVVSSYLQNQDRLWSCINYNQSTKKNSFLQQMNMHIYNSKNISRIHVSDNTISCTVSETVAELIKFSEKNENGESTEDFFIRTPTVHPEHPFITAKTSRGIESRIYKLTGNRVDIYNASAINTIAALRPSSPSLKSFIQENGSFLGFQSKFRSSNLWYSPSLTEIKSNQNLIYFLKPGTELIISNKDHQKYIAEHSVNINSYCCLGNENLNILFNNNNYDDFCQKYSKQYQNLPWTKFYQNIYSIE